MPIAKIPGRADRASLVEVFEPSRGGDNDPGEVILDRFMLNANEVRENYYVPTINTSYRFVSDDGDTMIDEGEPIAFNQAEIDTGRARLAELAPVYDRIIERNAELVQKRREKRVDEAQKRLEVATQQRDSGEGDYRYEDADDKPHDRLRLEHSGEIYIPKGKETIPPDIHERMGVEVPEGVGTRLDTLREASESGSSGEQREKRQQQQQERQKEQEKRQKAQERTEHRRKE